MMVEGVSVKASAEVVERVRNSEAVVQVACTVLERQRNRCSTQSVRSEKSWLVSDRGSRCRSFRVEIPRNSTSITHSRIIPMSIM